MTDKDWADRLHLKAIKNMKGKRYYLSAQDEVFDKEDAIKQVEYEVFSITGNMPEERQVVKILKAIALQSEEQGDHQYSIFYRVGKTQGGHIAIDLCNSAKQYLVLDIVRENIRVFHKDQLNDVPKRYQAWFYCDDHALSLLEPEYVDTVVAMALTFNYAIQDPKAILAQNLRPHILTTYNISSLTHRCHFFTIQRIHHNDKTSAIKATNLVS